MLHCPHLTLSRLHYMYIFATTGTYKAKKSCQLIFQYMCHIFENSFEWPGPRVFSSAVPYNSCGGL
jgi:hypothetical protein